MRITQVFVLLAGCRVRGWTPCCSPKRRLKRAIQKKVQTKIIAGAAVAAGGALVSAAAGAVALSQINNNNQEVYEPSPGSMVGKVVVITGGSSGLGLESSKRLAAAGATVVLTSRTGARAFAAARTVIEYLDGRGMDSSNVYSLKLDLDDLSNVREFGTAYGELGLGDISVLLNNAGVMAIPSRELTADGNERTFQSNHLGHFVLTSELFPYFSRESTRVVTVSSSASNFAGPTLDMQNLNGERVYAPWTSYGISKLANILFSNELQKRANDAGLEWLTSVSLHPGVVNTDLWRYLVGEERLEAMKSSDNSMSVESFVANLTSLFTLTPEQGANTQIYLCAEEGLTKGAFYEDMKRKKNVPPYARDLGKARALWEESERLGGVQFDLTMDSVSEAEGEDMGVENRASDEESSDEESSDEESSSEETTEEGTEEEEEPGEDSG